MLLYPYPALQLHVAVNVLLSVYCHLNAVPAAFVSLVPLTDHPLKFAFAFVIVLLLVLAGVKLASYVALPELILPLPPSPAAYVTVYPFAVQLQLVPLHTAAVPVLLLLV